MTINKLRKEIRKASLPGEFVVLVNEIFSNSSSSLAEVGTEKSLELLDLLINRFDEVYVPMIEGFNREEFDEFWKFTYWEILDKPLRKLASFRDRIKSDGETKIPKLFLSAQKKIITGVNEDIKAGNKSPLLLSAALASGFAYDEETTSPETEEIIKKVDDLLLDFINKRQAKDEREYISAIDAIHNQAIKEQAATSFCTYVKDRYEGKLDNINSEEKLELMAKFMALYAVIENAPVRLNSVWAAPKELFEEIWGKYVVSSTDLTNDKEVFATYKSLDSSPKYQFAFLLAVNAVNPGKAEELFAMKNNNGLGDFGSFFMGIPGGLGLVQIKRK